MLARQRATIGGVRNYRPSTYGDGFADVYDEWYGSRLPDVTPAVERLLALAAGGSILELGVGTGRLALPLAEQGARVFGVDASQAMLAQLEAKMVASASGARITVACADMAELEPPGPFAVIFVAFNTIFNLDTAEAQQRCVTNVAARLAPGGRFVVEAVVPADDESTNVSTNESNVGSTINVRTIEVDRVVLSVSRHDRRAHVAFGQEVEIRETGIRLRPWRIRWIHPAELDAMAERAGLRLEHRWSDWTGAPFDDASDRHVSVYRRAVASPA